MKVITKNRNGGFVNSTQKMAGGGLEIINIKKPFKKYNKKR